MAGVMCKSVTQLLLVLSLAGGALSLGLPCKAEGQTCSALLSFFPKMETNLSAITALFQLSSYRQLLGANAWSLSVAENTTIQKGVTVKVPITCACKNDTGISQGGPIYTVLPSDTLSIIADTIFGGLLTYEDIVAVNPKIKDPNKIYAGDKHQIPLPCTCSASASASASSLHYSYVVQPRNTLEVIASEMGSNLSVLMTVNNITNSSILAAGQLIDVPLKACSSNISKQFTDRNLLVANGSYAITASNCLQCSCGPSDLDLYCTPAPLSASCSSMRCKNSNLIIGNITTQRTNAGCNVTKCSYNGYINKTFLTLLETSLQPQCPAKHALPALTTPPSIVAAPPPGAVSPGTSPSTSPSSSPSPGSTGMPSSPTSGSPPSPSRAASPGTSTPSKSMAADSLNSLSLASMLLVGLPLLNHFGEW